MLRKLLVVLGVFIVVLVVLVIIYKYKTDIRPPQVNLADYDHIEVRAVSDSLLVCDNGWLRKNKHNFWELYLEGDAAERGVAFGKLTEKLMAEKEAAFVGEIKKRIPNENYLNFLKYFISWFNRDIDEFIPEEIKLEIYAGSQYMPDEFDFIGAKYNRALNYHAAHDIGHALQNMNLVGCTAFAVWDEHTKNHELLIGRNFDFYFGDEFAKDKIIAFYNPDRGHKFASVTWAGFSGVVSGMNEKGLTVTLNSAKSDIPTRAKTPVSVIGRMILQYASTIEEAYDIALQYDSFVAETFLIGSKADQRAALIEKSVDTTVLHTVDRSKLIVTNHYLSEALKNSSLNLEYMSEEVSQHRYARVDELIGKKGPLAVEEAAQILRDQCGVDSAFIGLGNERAINQLLAHHSIIFSPYTSTFWISSPPYMLGSYAAYNLEAVFSHSSQGTPGIDSLEIAPDPFLYSDQYDNYRVFSAFRDRLQQYSFTQKPEFMISDAEAGQFVESNPESYLPYYYLGEYYFSTAEYNKAIEVLEKGLTKEIARTSERKKMEENLAIARKKATI